MRKLDRSLCPTPACLGTYHHGTHSWGNVLPEHKEEIRAHLEVVQGRRCAYCEGDIDALGQHIEHFRRKSVYPVLTFDWSNLYWSCDQTDSCGHFKDRGAGRYNVADIIDPCTDDPDDYLIFRADGTITVRQDLSAHDAHRARETLRVFSLDAEWGRLRKMRKAAVSGYVKGADEAFSAGLSIDEIRSFFTDELEYARALPFYTAIKHVLTKR